MKTPEVIAEDIINDVQGCLFEIPADREALQEEIAKAIEQAREDGIGIAIQRIYDGRDGE